jgi:hypothetical protein
MKRIIFAGMLAAAQLAAAPAHAAWTRSYAIEWYEPAFYFGGEGDDMIGKGTDCPEGIHDVDWVKVMVDAGYTEEQAKWLRNPANPTRSPYFGQAQMAFRGKNRANVYIHPESTPESGELKPVASKIGEGLDLDGNRKNGFTSPTGETGIDNNFYKAIGCWKSYRGPPRKSTNAENNMNGMREGGWTVVIVVSGKGDDPMNEKDAEVAFYSSSDKLVKDGLGNIARDYTFRVKPDRRGEAIFKARVVDGKIITESLPEAWIMEPDRGGGYLQLYKARAELTMQPDGTLKGYLGGYRNWRKIYEGWLHYIGPSMEALSWVRLPDVWYAWRRYADYSPPEAKGEKTHISIAIRVDAVPAYVSTPDGKSPVTQIASFKEAAPIPVDRPHMLAIKAPDGLEYEWKDGIMVLKGQQAISQTADQLRPPQESASAASGGSKGG